MANIDNILEVKNLKISFRTMNGTVKAVRNIDFNLKRGETLAIVGESGSGKSVTSKAILGILAGNSIVESGEIIYDGRDLLKITEEEMCKIRGDKISMIFQDPLSALDSIVKIGKQITEAMLLKNKTNRKRARGEFNSLLGYLKEHMLTVSSENDEINAEAVPEMIETFDSFNILAIKLENAYNTARTHAEELKADIEHFLFLVSKMQKVDVKKTLSEFRKTLIGIKNDFLTVNYNDKIDSFANAIEGHRAAYTPARFPNGELIPYAVISDGLKASLEELAELLGEIVSGEQPNFFRIGYYVLKNPEAKVDGSDIHALNEMALDYLNENFMNSFIEYEKLAIMHSHRRSIVLKKQVLTALNAAKRYFTEQQLVKAETISYASALIDQVEHAIDRLEYIKDSTTYTFGSSLMATIKKYFLYEKLNPKEERRFATQTAKHEALKARGKKVDWKVVPKNVYSLDALRGEMVSIIDRLYAKFEADIEGADTVDYNAISVGLIDYLKARASEVVHKVTKRMAKDRAIKLMEEVGIPEPRIRYNQYPFEFSGGMRQRIVIAIALAANPDILICDEPTTALDVTIQSQILELINDLKEKRNLSVIFITHDLGVVANMADKIAVMYAGKIVELGTSEDIFYDPRHPYTWALLSSMPDLDTNEKLDAIPGTPPNMIYPPVGDAFAARNKYALKIDFEEQPPMFEVSETHRAATWLLHPDAPKVEMPKIISDRIARMKAKGGIDDDGE